MSDLDLSRERERLEVLRVIEDRVMRASRRDLEVVFERRPREAVAADVDWLVARGLVERVGASLPSLETFYVTAIGLRALRSRKLP